MVQCCGRRKNKTAFIEEYCWRRNCAIRTLNKRIVPMFEEGNSIMKNVALKGTLKELIGAVVFNLLIEAWIIIDIAYNIKWSIYVFALACIGITVFFVKAQHVKKCILNASMFGIMCAVICLLIDQIKFKFGFYDRIFNFELNAGDGLVMITVYVYSVIFFIGGSIISVLLSRRSQKYNKTRNI